MREGKKTFFQRNFYIKLIAAIALFSYLFFYMPTPYVVYQPGKAMLIRPMVEVSSQDNDEEGSIYLTTVSMSYPYANVYKTLRSFLSPHMDLAKRKDVFGDESTEEYSERQSYVMRTSQSNAIQAVYNELGIPYEVKTQSISVLSTMPGTSAEKLLRPGDQILEIDERIIHEPDDMLQYIAEKQVGEEVEVKFLREGKERSASIRLTDISAHESSQGEEKPRPGIGIYLAIVETVAAEREEDQVNLVVENIGGPSAGLMFALEIYDLLTAGDLTKGYRIAGTGTITVDGKVGVIGGVDYKVVGAHRQKADIFFTPHDLYPKDGQSFQPILNYTIAKEKAKQLNTDMKIIPVDTLQEAIQYLKSLPPKQAG